MHIVISCVGSAGDVYPFLAIGQALMRRGHEVEILTSPRFKSNVEAAGTAFVPFGTIADYERVVANSNLWHPRRSFATLWQEMQPRLVDAHRVLLARVRPGKTVLVGSTLAWHVRLLQETHGIAAATVHLAPACFFSALAPPVLPGLGDLRRWPTWSVRTILTLADRGVLDRLVAPGLDRVRAELGLPPVRRIMSRWIHSPDLVVCAWPEWFAPHQNDWPPRSETTGFARWPAAANEHLAPALLDFLDAGAPPIAFTPGSAMAHGRHFFETAVAACAALRRRALLISPYTDQLPTPLPHFAHAVGYAPFDRLLPRMAALVHHGGIGTSAQALGAGVPQALVPFAHDQFDNAAHLARLGVGQRLAWPGSARAWGNALVRLSTDPAVAAACARSAAQMGGFHDAPDRIAACIERLAPGEDEVRALAGISRT